ncbi:hypothetical protein [Pyrinomonas sp.]|uniref:hypothetical protein n=1 Tax=Pyrinomonas sp. TaxID=2080306 RepID=UPI003319E29C
MRLLAALFCLLLAAATSGIAQEIFQAPPPLVLIPKEERERLAAARDAKARLHLSLELSEARLMRAEKLVGAQMYDDAVKELGIYRAIIEDELRALKASNAGVNRQRDLYRRFEIGLRAQLSRLEAIRRVMPSEQSANMRALVRATRRVRAEALNSFYGYVVIRESDDEGEEDDGAEAASEQMRKRDEP